MAVSPASRRLRHRVAGALLAAALVAVAGPARAQAQRNPRALVEAARLADQSRLVLERLARLRERSDELAQQERALRGELDRLRRARAEGSSEAARASAALREASSELTSTIARLDRLQTELDAERPVVAARLVALYKLGSLGYRRLLLEAGDVRQAGRGYRLMATLSRLDRERFERYRATLLALRETRDDLRLRVDAAVALTTTLEADGRVIDEKIAGGSQRLLALDDQQERLGSLADRLNEARTAVAAGLETAPLLPLEPFKGDLDWPLRGQIVAGFGRQRASRFGTQVRRNGVEIAAGAGTLARAVHEGRVAYAAPFDGYGRVVILDHGEGAYTLYGHLEELAVEAGSLVDRGTPLGRVGRQGQGPPRLYFELRIDGEPVDPVQWLRRFSPSSVE